MVRRIRPNLAAGANAGAAADLMDDLPALVEAPESPPGSPRAGSAPAPPCAAAAPTTAPRQPPAAAHRNPRAAPARRVAAGQRQAESSPEPGSPPPLVDGALLPSLDGAPGSTTAAQTEQAEDRAEERAGLALMNPRRRLLKDIYPAWADPRTFASREELKAKTGYALQVRVERRVSCCRSR